MKPNRKIKLLSFGEILWDLIDGKAYIGGAPFNLAAHAARCGLDAYLLTAVGSDDAGCRASREIDRLGIRRKYVLTAPGHPTGTVTVTLSEGGQPSYVIHQDVAWDFIDLGAGMEGALSAESFDVVCIGTLAQRGAVSSKCLGRVLDILKSVPVFYDVNLRQDFFSRELILAGLQRATILKLNHSEVSVLSELIFGCIMDPGAFVRTLQATFPIHIILVTLGERGCLVAEKGSLQMIEGCRVNVADTVGAGDAFSAAFLAGWMRGKPALAAAEMGNRLGAFVASHSGAIPDYNNEIRQGLGLTEIKENYK